MSRVALFFVAIVALVFSVIATPVDLEKRVTHSGRGTWFNVGLGACGETNVDTDLIVAVSSQRWNSGGNCEQYVEVTNTANGNSAYALTRDQCPGCGANDLDMSPALFKKLGSLDEGVLSISWHFKDKDWSP